ncbi:uncharacterized protein LOC141601480 [Silene latifolia]|uniref:uncharacterized protein LOC141601480 n=1 Tax=Silene latifolia TaxID=37657 RepID=UPI003D76E368
MTLSIDREAEVAKIRAEVASMLRSARIVVPESVAVIETTPTKVARETDGMTNLKESGDTQVINEVQQPPPKGDTEGIMLKLTLDDVQEEIDYWSFAIYGYVMGANPPWRAMKGYLRREWQDYEISEIAFLPNSLFVVRFATMEHGKLVLEKGMFLFDGKPMIVRPWEPNTKITKVSVKTVPIWVKLMGLDLKFWGTKCLEKLASIIGKFVRVDDLTLDKSLLGFARVMVEVGIDQHFPEKIMFMDEMGHNMTGPNKQVWKRREHVATTADTADFPKLPHGGLGVPQPGLSGIVNRVQNSGKGVMITPTNTPVNNSTSAVLTPARILTRITRHESRLPGVKEGAFVVKFNKEMASTTQMKDIKWCLHHANVDLFGLLETRVRPGSLNKVVDSFCNGWNFITNHQYHDGGRIWLLWKEEKYDVDVIEMDAQFIHIKVKDIITNFQFFATYVYGFNKIEDRVPLWTALVRFVVVEPWIVLRDFNNVLHMDEKIGLPVKDTETIPFQNTIDNCGLQDMKSTGSFFTWNNKQPSSTRVISRIDRVLINDEWVNKWPDHFAYYVPEGDYDHFPCLIQCDDTNLKKKDLLSFSTCGLGYLSLRKLLRQDGITAFRLDPYNSTLMDNEYNLRARFKMMNKAKMDILKQKAKCEWAQEGDANTTLFHRAIKQQQISNKVMQIHDKHGDICKTPETIMQAFVEYYLDLLGSQGGTDDVYTNIVIRGTRLPNEDWTAINREPTKAEIKSIIFDIPDGKSSGADGYSSCFFKAGWDIMGDDIYEAIIDFFRGGQMLKQLNSTTLVLIPKIKNPTSVKEFRPLACCNTIHKVISKILCARIAVVLPKLINPAQAAFIKGHSIMGNILIS